MLWTLGYSDIDTTVNLKIKPEQNGKQITLETKKTSYKNFM
jgi:hypothetical protein